MFVTLFSSMFLSMIYSMCDTLCLQCFTMFHAIFYLLFYTFKLFNVRLSVQCSLLYSLLCFYQCLIQYFILHFLLCFIYCFILCSIISIVHCFCLMFYPMDLLIWPLGAWFLSFFLFSWSVFNHLIQIFITFCLSVCSSVYPSFGNITSDIKVLTDTQTERQINNPSGRFKRKTHKRKDR
jgi:hypothetical protein